MHRNLCHQRDDGIWVFGSLNGQTIGILELLGSSMATYLLHSPSKELEWATLPAHELLLQAFEDYPTKTFSKDVTHLVGGSNLGKFNVAG